MYHTFSLIEGKHRLLLWNHINLRAKAVYMEQRRTHFSCGRTVKENETRYEMKNILAYVLTHVSKHIMRPTFHQPSKTTREQWPIRTDFDKSPLELSAHSPDSWTFTGIYPPFMLILALKGHISTFPLKWKPSVTDTLVHIRMHPQNAKLSHKTNIWHPSHPRPQSRKAKLHNWWAATDTCSPVLPRNPWNWFEIIMQKGFSWQSCVSLCSCTYSHQCFSCIFYINRQFCTITADRNHLFTLQHFKKCVNFFLIKLSYHN